MTGRPVDGHVSGDRVAHGLTLDRHGQEILDESTCLALLAAGAVGRLGFSSGALPVIFPVNYLLADRTLVFGSEEGEKSRAARKGAVACFEIDESDRVEHDGWNVLATGKLSVVPSHLHAEYAHLPLLPWAVGTPQLFIELSVELVTGRRIRRVAR